MRAKDKTGRADAVGKIRNAAGAQERGNAQRKKPSPSLGGFGGSGSTRRKTRLGFATHRPIRPEKT